MNLQEFLPYRLAVVAESVSRSVAQVYATRFSLTRDEWRVLAALVESGRMPMKAAALTTTLDKMQVSRAVSRLESAGLVVREEDPGDRRGRILMLTSAGRGLLRRLLPMVEAREAFLLETLSEDERRLLDGLLERLLERSQQLQRQG
ncbi:MAG: MarR family transcriptional regulator [Burkholderiaceae bacterium]|nr:MarR family transcriptional regulator [Burkholderiaceae bacterium]